MPLSTATMTTRIAGDGSTLSRPDTEPTVFRPDSRGAFDVLITDIQTRGRDGYSFCCNQPATGFPGAGLLKAFEKVDSADAVSR